MNSLMTYILTMFNERLVAVLAHERLVGDDLTVVNVVLGGEVFAQVIGSLERLVAHL